MRCKLPIGIQTFSLIREEGHCYVDKTPLVARMAAEGKYYFLSRPRRFGKSLLVSTLAEAFAGHRALFEGLYLANHWDWERRSPVIRIDLGQGVVRSREDLERRLMRNLGLLAETHDHTLSARTPDEALEELVLFMHHTTGERVVVLVDEYDKPILDNLHDPAQARLIRDALRSLYSVIKIQDAHLRFGFLTGVSKFSKVSLFSGLNNLIDITLDPRYATLCGYTQQELQSVFADYLEDVDLEQVRHWYNGYNFLGERVYNPFDVLLYLDSRLLRPYWFESGTPTFLVELMRRRGFDAAALEQIEVTDRLLGSFDIDAIEPETLLFQTGYLTIQGERGMPGAAIYQLGLPNQEVRQSLSDHFLAELSRSGQRQDRNKLGLYDALEADDPAALERLFHAFFAAIPHDWYRNNQLAGYEGYYASVVYCYFAALGIDLIAEDATNHGRIDLTVRHRGRVWLIEFKVNEMTQPGRALDQLKARGYAAKYAGSPVTLIGIEFSRESRNLSRFEWERLTPAPG
jgi:hypothetical protein